jgi:hypothetical protein
LGGGGGGRPPPPPHDRRRGRRRYPNAKAASLVYFDPFGDNWL